VRGSSLAWPRASWLPAALAGDVEATPMDAQLQRESKPATACAGKLDYTGANLPELNQLCQHSR
jgi:hypothetical protein